MKIPAQAVIADAAQIVFGALHIVNPHPPVLQQPNLIGKVPPRFNLFIHF
ncbi:hypothetical protein [Neisseria chenwenguii]|nr:hypothetical protein [Neisseria chenwenguii]